MSDFRLVGTLNVQGGLNSDIKTRSIRQWITQNKLSVACLTECHGNLKSVTRLFKYFPQSIWCFRQVDIYGGVGIAVSGNGVKLVSGRVMSGSNMPDQWTGRCVCATIIIDDEEFEVVCIYAPANPRHRIGFFDFVQDWLRKDLLLATKKLIMAGDFNCTINNLTDRIPPKISLDEGSASLNTMLVDIELDDVAIKFDAIGSKYITFPSDLGGSRIDYVFASKLVMPFIQATQTNPTGLSDHHAVIISLRTSRIESGPGRWVLNCSLLKDERALNILKSTWISTRLLAEADQLNAREKFILCESITRSVAVKLTKIRSQNFKKKHLQAQKQLDKSWKILATDPTNEQFQKQYSQCHQTCKLLADEKSSGDAIRSRSRWLLEGESSTRYFFQLAKNRQVDNSIPAIKNQFDDNLSRPDDILGEIDRYYAELYNSEPIDEQETNNLA